jgi:hypothetical protein
VRLDFRNAKDARTSTIHHPLPQAHSEYPEEGVRIRGVVRVIRESQRHITRFTLWYLNIDISIVCLPVVRMVEVIEFCGHYMDAAVEGGRIRERNPHLRSASEVSVRNNGTPTLIAVY